MNPIAKRIRDCRVKAGLSEKELARKCGLSAAYIAEIESGRKIINEAAATAILKVFGETLETGFEGYEEPAPAAPVKPVPKAPVKGTVNKPPEAAPIPSEPTPQWEGALANIIKRFEIRDIRSGKPCGERELPVLNRRIDGIPWERLQLFQVSDDEAAGLRIRKGDILWVLEMKDLQGDGVYLLEQKGIRQVRRVRRQGLRLLLCADGQEGSCIEAAPGSVKILGKCQKAEYRF